MKVLVRIWQVVVNARGGRELLAFDGVALMREMGPRVFRDEVRALSSGVKVEVWWVLMMFSISTVSVCCNLDVVNDWLAMLVKRR